MQLQFGTYNRTQISSKMKTKLSDFYSNLPLHLRETKIIERKMKNQNKISMKKKIIQSGVYCQYEYFKPFEPSLEL